MKGAFGRKAGSGPGFSYSPAMKRSTIVWDDKTLDAFLTDPQASVPGNSMPFPGISDAKQRTEAIEYIKSVK